MATTSSFGFSGLQVYFQLFFLTVLSSTDQCTRPPKLSVYTLALEWSWWGEQGNYREEEKGAQADNGQQDLHGHVMFTVTGSGD